MTQKKIFGGWGLLLCWLFVVAGLSCLGSWRKEQQSATSQPKSLASPGHQDALPRKVEAAFAHTPLLFERNVGQFTPDVRFLSRGDGCDVALTRDGAILKLSSPPAKNKNEKRAPDAFLQMALLGVRPSVAVTGEKAAPTKVNYFVGNDATKWHTGVKTFGSVHYRGVYPGVDALYYGNQRQLEYDFQIAPNVDPRVIALKFRGTQKVELNAHGELMLHVGDRTVVQHAPRLYQTVSGKRHRVQGSYSLRSNPTATNATCEVGFHIGRYNHHLPLVIDPTIAYSTAFYEDITGIAVDGGGNVYVAGSTYYSADYASQTLPGGGKPTFLNGSLDEISQIYVAKINASATAVSYMTFYGGNGDTSCNHAAVTAGNLVGVDGVGNAYVIGSTRAANLPIVNGFQTALADGGQGVAGDTVLLKLDPTGSKILYSTYYGGRAGTDDDGNATGGDDSPSGLGVDSAGNAYIAGSTSVSVAQGGTFPTKNAFQTPSTTKLMPTTFVGKINTAAKGDSSLVFSTLFGSLAYCYGMAIDKADNVYITGDVSITPNLVDQDSGDVQDGVFPFQSPLPGTRTKFPRNRDKDGTLHDGYYGGGYVAKFSGSGSLLFATVDIGGAYGCIAHDNANGLYIAWETYPSEMLPGGTTSDRYGERVAKINDNDSGLAYETAFGGADGSTRNGTPFLEWPLGATVDSQGRLLVTGFTNSLGFPHVDPLPSPFSPSASKKNAAAFLVQLSADGRGFVFSTEYGGDGIFKGESVAVDPSDNIYVAGRSGFQGTPVQNGLPLQYGGGFVLKLGTPVSTGVNSTGDRDDTSPGDGACYTGQKTSSGTPECTLRASIQEANASTKSEPYPITFNIPGQGATIPSIAPKKPLPAISHTVKIDGTTQPSSNRVELTGGSAGTASGLTILAGGSTVQGLVVNGFKTDAILLMNRGGNTIQNCFIGLDKTGTSAKSNGQSGIHALKSPNNLIGGDTVPERNIISGTRVTASTGDAGYGVWIDSGSTSNQVQGNFIGTDKSGGKAVPNGIGIVVGTATLPTSPTSSSLGTLIGGLAKTPGAVPGNVIAGNSNIGLAIGYASGNTIEGNLVGTNLAGTGAVPNVHTGIRVFRASGNTVGGTATGVRNIISGNGEDGVQIFGLQATKNTVAGNYIGTDINGTKALGNAKENVYLLGSAGNTIGGTTAQARNIIAGSTKGYGVFIRASKTNFDAKSGADSASSNTVAGNYIGTGVAGAGALPNAFGLVIAGAGSAPNSVVAASKNIVTGNTISGNSGIGVGLAEYADTNTVQNNFIGTNPTGTSLLGNGVYGVLVQQARSNTLAGNTVSGNGRAGVVFVGSPYPSGYAVAGFLAPTEVDYGVGANTLKSNYIGTTSGGLRALPNGAKASGGKGAGVLILTGGGGINGANSIGVPGAGNVISGNSGSGIAFVGGSNNIVQANLIGVSGNGVAGLPNSGDGVSMACIGNNIGGLQASQGNTIAYNGASGVRVSAGHDNLILSNRIFANKRIGIDLDGGKESDYGVTPNDAGDGDSGANNLQNYPEITSIVRSSGGVSIGGTLDSTPSTAYIVQFFANALHDPSGYGQGQRLLGNLSVTTGKDGHARFTFKYSGALATSEAVSMTATGARDDLSTSEFSALPHAISGGVYRYITDPHNAKATIKQGMANVTLQRLEDGELAAQESTEADGTYSFSAAPLGQFAIVPSFKGTPYPFVFAPMLRSVTVARDVTGVDFFTYNIGGTVKNAAGKAMSGVKVTLSASTDEGNFTRTLTTNTQGTYLFDGLGLGTYKITASGYVASVSSLKLPSSGTAGVSPNGQINLNVAASTNSAGFQLSPSGGVG